MRTRLAEKGADPGNVVVIPNWVDVDALTPRARDNDWAREHELVDPFVVMHSGNIGHAQNLDSLIRSATFLRDLDDLRIVLIGGGARRQELKDLARLLEVEQVRFFGYQPREVLPESLSSADIHVVGLAKGLSGYVVPSRLYGILAVGRPVIVAADAESETAQVVREAEAGVVVPPNRPDLLAARDPQGARRGARPGVDGAEAGASTSRGADRVVAIGRYRALLRDLVGENGRREQARRGRSSASSPWSPCSLVAIGRWEREHRADEEVRGMERVLVAIGPLDNPTLASFRFQTEFQCLGYRRGEEPGRARGVLRLPTAASSRPSTAAQGEAKIWSLREDPTSSTLRRDRARGRPPARADGRAAAADRRRAREGRELSLDRARAQLEGGIQALVAALIVWTALGASSVWPWNIPVGRTMRWVVLAELAAFALLYVWLRPRREVRLSAWVALATALPALAVLLRAVVSGSRLDGGARPDGGRALHRRRSCDLRRRRLC